MKLLHKFAGLALFLSFGLVSCEEKEVVNGTNTLSVEPSETITFKASGNKAVELTVITDAEEWEYTVPEWIDATREGDVLSVNAKDNDSEDSKAGRITFTAGNAKPVNISVLQESVGGTIDDGGDDGDDEDLPEKGPGISFKDQSDATDADLKIGKETTVVANMTVTLSEASDAAVTVEVSVDKDYLAEYDYEHGTSSTILPDGVATADAWTVTIPAGETSSAFSVSIDGSTLEYNTSYLLPLTIKVTEGEATVMKSASRVNYMIVRQNPKEVKQMVMFEINDVNPLNALEVKLEDGSYFMDAVVLFSGNIAWDANAIGPNGETGSVRFNARTGEDPCNSNISALLAEPEVYIKPLHDAGIKVYMGIMPHHTPASISSLSDQGCEAFAKDMAQIVYDCYLDGVLLDEEYAYDGGYGVPTPWWTENSHGASYFAYQLKKQMKDVCPWPTDVAVFDFSVHCGNSVTDHVDGTKHGPEEFVDILVPNYGSRSEPYTGMTYKNCGYAATELNLGYSNISESVARAAKDAGYGWLMWFAYNPPQSSYKNTATPNAESYFNEASKGAYGQELQPITHYYKKQGEGLLDPTRYAY